MAFEVLTTPPEPSKHPKFVTATTEQSVGGAYFAVIMWWNPDMGGFWEPWDTGIGRYATREEALNEALTIANDEQLPFYSGESNDKPT